MGFLSIDSLIKESSSSSKIIDPAKLTYYYGLDSRPSAETSNNVTSEPDTLSIFDNLILVREESTPSPGTSSVKILDIVNKGGKSCCIFGDLSCLVGDSIFTWLSEILINNYDGSDNFGSSFNAVGFVEAKGDKEF